MTCTCLPLNRRLMAHLLKVDEGSVHEQGCVERVAAESATHALADLRERVEGMTGYVNGTTIDGDDVWSGMQEVSAEDEAEGPWVLHSSWFQRGPVLALIDDAIAAQKGAEK